MMLVFFAHHSPGSSNQTLERTADQREDLLSMTSTLKPEAQLALTHSLPLTRSHHHAIHAVHVAVAQLAPFVSGRSAFSR
jgi:hypothetical protein